MKIQNENFMMKLNKVIGFKLIASIQILFIGILLFSGLSASASKLKMIDEKLGSEISQVFEECGVQEVDSLIAGKAYYVDWLKCSTQYGRVDSKPLCAIQTSLGAGEWDRSVRLLPEEMFDHVYSVLMKLPDIAASAKPTTEGGKSEFQIIGVILKKPGTTDSHQYEIQYFLK